MTLSNIFLAVSELGIKEYLPAYLDPELKPQDLLTGVSFGSAGTGYDTLTATTFVSSFPFSHMLHFLYFFTVKNMTPRAARLNQNCYILWSG